MKFKNKIRIIYFFIIAIPIITLSFLVSNQYKALVLERFTVYAEHTVKQMINYWDQSFYQINRLLYEPYYDIEFQNNLINCLNKHDQDDIHINPVIDNKLRNMLNANIGINFIGIYDTNGKIATWKTNQRGYNYNYNLANTPYFKDIQSSRQVYLIKPYEQQTIIDSTEEVITLVQTIKDNKKNKIIGYLQVDLTMSYIENIVYYNELLNSSGVLILDQNGEIIFSKNYKEGLDDDYIYSSVKSAVNGWQFTLSSPKAEITEEIKSVRNYNVVILILIIFCAIILSSIASQKLTKPIKDLRIFLKHIGEGQLQHRFKWEHRDEFKEVGHTLNEMLDNLNELIEREYQAKINQKNAQLYALQNQINPHFLFNTLESISMKAELNEDYEVADMIGLLGRLFRYTLTSEHELVYLIEEIKYVKNYVRLLQLRFSREIDLEAKVPEYCEKVLVPKVILQPIIENTLKYGYNGKEKELSIVIKGELKDDFIEISIRDYGKGISKNQVQELNNRIKNWRDKNVFTQEHIGLLNVHKRLQLLYGETYGVTIEEENIGANIKILLPVGVGKDV